MFSIIIYLKGMFGFSVLEMFWYKIKIYISDFLSNFLYLVFFFVYKMVNVFEFLEFEI